MNHRQKLVELRNEMRDDARQEGGPTFGLSYYVGWLNAILARIETEGDCGDCPLGRYEGHECAAPDCFVEDGQ